MAVSTVCWYNLSRRNHVTLTDLKHRNRNKYQAITDKAMYEHTSPADFEYRSLRWLG